MSLTTDQETRLRDRLLKVYAVDTVEELLPRVIEVSERFEIALSEKESREERFTAEDVFLITYGDMVQTEGEAPLATLHKFCRGHLADAVNTIHILPCFPWSSDDGFSVIEYRKIDPALGDWSDLESMSEDFRLMYDYVCNHCSAESEWFEQFKKAEQPGIGYFITVDPDKDLSRVVRPRPSPVLTPVETDRGTKHVWTTFSADQVDLNFKNPDLLVEMLDIMLLYFARGARVLRLDAIAFLWKEIGTSCIHLPETHQIVKLMRDLVDILCPQCILLTETNVPHQENVSYFGDGEGDEAHMVYQFSLPPLLLHAILFNQTDHLNRWLESLEEPPANCTYLNFTASHDGIGVRPLEGIIDEVELKKVIAAVEEREGRISYRTKPDGSESPYELNITYYDAVSRPGAADDENVCRFVLTQAVAMTLQGVPALYFHSFFGTHNDQDGVKKTGRARTINRRKWQLTELEDILGSTSSHKKVFERLTYLVSQRRVVPAFDPKAAQEIWTHQVAASNGQQDTLAVYRCAKLKDDNQDAPGAELLAVFNFSNETKKAHLPKPKHAEGWTYDLAAEELTMIAGAAEIEVAPYRFVWLTTRPVS